MMVTVANKKVNGNASRRSLVRLELEQFEEKIRTGSKDCSVRVFFSLEPFVFIRHFDGVSYLTVFKARPFLSTSRRVLAEQFSSL